MKQASGARCAWRCVTARNSARNRNRRRRSLISKARSYLFSYSKCLLYAGANGRTAQVIAGQKKSRKARQVLVEGSQPLSVAEVVLRQRTRPDGDVAECGRALDREQGSEFPMNEARKFFGT